MNRSCLNGSDSGFLDGEDNEQKNINLLNEIKVTKSHVDPMTIAVRSDNVSFPRSEESSADNTSNFSTSQPRPTSTQCCNKTETPKRSKSKKRSTSKSNCTGKKENERKPSRKPTTPSIQQQPRSSSLPSSQSKRSPTRGTGSRSKSRSRNRKRSPTNNSKTTTATTGSKPVRSKKAPSTKQRKKTSSDTGLGAFLHRNTVHEIIKQEAKRVLKGANHDDTRSIGSRSMASMSVSDRSRAERSKAEESLAKRTKERRGAKATTIAETVNQSVSKLPDNLNSTMTSIDEMSISDFSKHSSDQCKGVHQADSFELPKMKNSLGGFLSQEGDIVESTNVPNDQKDTVDNSSILSASTLGSKSVSVRSKAEQSISEQKLRERIKFDATEALTEESDQHNKEDGEGCIPPEKVFTVSNAQFLNKTDAKKAPTLDDSLDLKDAVVPRAEKKLRFQDGHTEKYLSMELTTSMYDDLFYTSEELAQFRYEAFMEEAGLDINEFH